MLPFHHQHLNLSYELFCACNAMTIARSASLSSGMQVDSDIGVKHTHIVHSFNRPLSHLYRWPPGTFRGSPIDGFE